MRRILCPLILSFLPAVAMHAQDVVTYQMPPAEIAKLADAPPTPAATLSPAGDTLALLQAPTYPDIADLAQPEAKLAGLRFNPENLDQTRAPYYISLRFRNINDDSEGGVEGFPAGARMRNFSWSPDGRRVAVTVSREGAVELWVIEVQTRKASRLGDVRLNNAYPTRPFHWLADSSTIAVRAVPGGDRVAPGENRVPSGPVIQENLGRRTPARTYTDLLRNASDAETFEHHMQSQPVLVTLDGSATAVGRSGAIIRFEPSPDGNFFLIETLRRPFSFTLPESRFPRRLEVVNRNGEPVRQLADLPLADAVPTDFSAAREGVRDAGWRSDAAATVFWVEALDKGDPKVEVPARDRIFMLGAPFSGEPVKLADVGFRVSSILWGDDDLALISESWWKDRRTRTWRVDPSKPAAAPQLLWDRSFEDRYGDPGSPLSRPNRWGRRVLHTAENGEVLFLSGEGASPQGDRPFLDRFDLRTKSSRRLWRSEAPYYEFVSELLDDQGRRLLTRCESTNEPPNYFIRDLRTKRVKAITNFPHPSPQLADAKKELIRYKRADGLDLSGTLYLPPGYEPKRDGALPVLMWAYPQEFKSASAAAQVTDSPHRFIRVSSGSPLFWIVRGYAVLDDPAIPIIGEGTEEPNDTYVEQLVAGAQAAVDELVRRGAGDRNRMAIGGHSYGAFMTANLLAHSDLFRAGIARSGAYNRSLTPFSFQAEERSYWEATETYVKMSPFTHAHKINEPLLMTHGMDDNNTGTFPIQSERLYAAMKGLGGTVRLVMLPYESHGYRARQSVMHMLWEMDTWLERYVKNAKPPTGS